MSVFSDSAVGTIRGNARPVRTFLACPGLGHINRGYESFTRQCFDALRSDSQLDLWLFKGAGPDADHDKTIWCLRRTTWLARLANLFSEPYCHDAYYIEQATFTLALLRQVARFRPDVIFLSDPAMVHLLWRWRKATRGQFRLLLSNGGPVGPPEFPHADHIHQVSQLYYNEAVAAGRSAASQTLIPYGFAINDAVQIASENFTYQSALRSQLGLPNDRPIILTIGVINHSHKRMDYLIRELQACPSPRPFLAMIGATDDESARIISLAEELLGHDNYVCRTVPSDAVSDYLQSANVFVLASLTEGFSRALGEAFAAGLPCVTHDAPHSRFVLNELGWFGDLSKQGALTPLIQKAIASAANIQGQLQQRTAAYDRLSWTRLSQLYADMICRCARDTMNTVMQ